MMPARPTARVERAAEQLLAAHGLQRPPIDVERLATEIGITVVFDDVGRADVSGMLYRKPPVRLMVVNVSHAHHRQRFTIAHEIGHAELHDSDTYLDGSATLRFRDTTAAAGTDAEEGEANRFAVAILMPAQWVRDRFLELITGRRAPAEDEVVAGLAQEFDVSRQAMHFRLVNLNLVDPA